MTADSTSLPPWAEVEKHVLRAERQIQEKRDISTVHKLGTILTIIGFGSLIVLVVGILSDREQWEPWRAVISPLAHLIGIGGMIMVAAAWVTGSQRQRCDSMVRHHAYHHHREQVDSNNRTPRRDQEAIIARLVTLERRQRAEDDAFVDALSEQEDEPKMNGRRVMRMVRPPAPDDQRGRN